MKIAVCGKSISGLTLSRLLATKLSDGNVNPNNNISIDLFATLNDPARSIYRPHPLCEYTSLDFVTTTSSPDQQQQQNEIDQQRQNIIEGWVRKGLVTPSNAVHKVINKEGQVCNPSPCPDHLRVQRYEPKGGMFQMLHTLQHELPNGIITVHKEQLIGMSKRNHQWFLQALDIKEPQGPYDLVLFAYDAMPRANRKASFKQLLERGLPHTSTVVSSLAHSVSASAMTVVVNFQPPIIAPSNLNKKMDCIRFENNDMLAFATRNNLEDGKFRGLDKYANNKNSDVWTIVANPQWSYQMRYGKGGNNGGKWDKKRVGNDMIQAFEAVMAKIVKDDNYKGKRRNELVVPTFHWQGCSLLTQVDQSATAAGTNYEKPYILDAKAGLGFCGDVLGGQGVQGSLDSAIHMYKALTKIMEEKKNVNWSVTTLDSYMPQSWQFRTLQPFDTDTNCISGTFHGRPDPQDGLDHTWPTAVRISKGENVTQADSLAKYRKQQQRRNTTKRSNPQGGSGNNRYNPTFGNRRHGAKKQQIQ